KLRRQQERKRAELEPLRPAGGVDGWGVLDDPELVPRIVAEFADLADRAAVIDEAAAAARLREADRIVLEGAQGVLLDEVWGFHPHTTWSDCTFTGAEALVADRPVTRLGVLRAYATRHGPGPFPTDDPAWDLPEPHNPSDGWQGRFRVGPLDLVLVRYAAEVVGRLDGVVVTCLDRVGPSIPICAAYADRDRLDPGIDRELLGRALRGVAPIVTRTDPDGLLAAIADAAGAPVAVVSTGPTAADKRAIRPPSRS
ncbi:MAG: adenylosuccinate synthetase, partial [Myxococcota bacterium]